jgi:DEAD/DEAH box helicase domain-containing protein
VVRRCACRTGCPSCIGPSVDQGRRGKALALAVLRGMRSGRAGDGGPAAGAAGDGA